MRDGMEEKRYVILGRRQIGNMLGLSGKHVVIDRAMYNPEHPDEVKIMKFLSKDDIDFITHIPAYLVYPDYAIGKILNQGIRLLVRLLYPDIEDIPVGMMERAKLRGLMRPNDRLSILVKMWQARNRVARFEVAIENQKGKIVYESTIYGTLIQRNKGKR